MVSSVYVEAHKTPPVRKKYPKKKKRERIHNGLMMLLPLVNATLDHYNPYAAKSRQGC